MRALAFSLFAILLAAGPAAAQDAKAFLPIFSAEVFQQDLITMGKPELDGPGDAGAGSNPPQDTAAEHVLTYAPSPEVERRTRSKLLDSLMSSTADPAAQEQIEQSVSTDAVWLQFHQVLAKAGFSTTNLADVTAAYYIIVWEVVNGPEVSAHPAGIAAVRADVVAAYAADPRLKNLTDADKQEAASIMAYMATIAAASANQLRSAGDQANLETLQEEVHEAVLDQGLDLARLQLTDRGFSAR